MKKRMLALLTTLLLLAGIVAGCSDSSTPQDSSPGGSAPQGSSQSTGSAAESITFPLAEIYTVNAFAFSNTGQELDKSLFMEVMEERTNIHWDLTLVSSAELVERRGLSFNSGDYYDVYIKSGIDAIDTYKYAQQGIIIPLNDLIDQYMPNLKAALDREGVWADITSGDGNIYALPQLNSPELAAPAVFINQPWLDAVNKSMPTTPEEFLDVLRAFRNEDPNGNGQKDEYPIYAPQAAISMFMPIFGIAMDYSTMSMYDHDTGTITYVPTSDDYKKFIDFMANAYSEDLINKDCYTATWDDINAIGSTQDAIGVMATYGPYQHVGADKDEDFPALPPFNGQHSMPAGKGVGYGALVITDKCENPELICTWADYLYSEEGAILGRMGVEGKTYTMDDEGKYHWNVDGEYGADITTIRNTHTLFGWYPAPLVKAELFDKGQANPEEMYLYLQRQELLKYAAEAFPVLNWTEDELKEKSALVTTINTYVDQYQAEVVTGQQDLDATWDGYVDSLNSMGLERLMEIDKAAYDRWLAER